VLVSVPDVRRMGTEAAVQALQDAGFQVEKKHLDLYVGLEYVVKQSPGAGSKAPRGSTITIYVV
jgi:serine/threonine-protein kinase